METQNNDAGTPMGVDEYRRIKRQILKDKRKREYQQSGKTPSDIKRKHKVRPEGFPRSANRIECKVYMPDELFDSLVDTYMVAEFPGTFSAYICQTITNGTRPA